MIAQHFSRRKRSIEIIFTCTKTQDVPYYVHHNRGAENMEQKYSGLQKATSAAGGVEKMAKLLKVPHKIVRGWLKDDGCDVPHVVRRENIELQRAITAAGGREAMAAELGVTNQAVQLWVRQGFVPVRRAQQIEALYGVPRTAIMSPRLQSAIGVGGEL
ncbi:hypothetical protein Q3G72_009371 [Acer saccharum]|nr:hypothetical protein Q3G72_009371 [Acer saccharum]